MKKSDFETHLIENFTAKEVTDTGAALGDVQLNLMIALQRFRSLIKRRVKLIVNGMTTGKHKAIWHPQGLAADIYLLPEDGIVPINHIFKSALAAGFKGIGIYYNGVMYSFHLDLRLDLDWWGGYKNPKKGIKDWKYYPLINDPSKFV